MESGEASGFGLRKGGTHYVTLRLADALPRAVVEAWHDEVDRRLERLQRVRHRPVTEREERDVTYRTLGRVDRYLDLGRGSSVLRDERAAGAVEAVLWNGDGEAYQLLAWSVMPNHVHALISLCPGHTLDEVLQEWKSDSTRRVNLELRRTGSLWHPDTIDQPVTHPLEIVRLRASIVGNPEQANLHDWPFAGEATPLHVR
ncbi:MAG: transposase [Fimbriimonas sp.]